MSGDNISVKFMSQPGAMPAKSKPDARRVGILQQLAGPDGPVLTEKVDTDHNRVDYLTKHVAAAKQFKSVMLLTNTVHRVPPAVSLQEKVSAATKLLGLSP